MGTLVPGKEGMELMPNKPNGLGGWLVLIQISLYFTILRILVMFTGSFLTTFQADTWNALTSPGSSLYDPLWKPTLIFEAAANGVFLLLLVYLLVLMYQRKAVFSRWIILFFLGNLLVVVVDYALLLNLPLVTESEGSKSAQEIVRSLVTSLIWIPYFIRSKRVRNTFI